VSIPLLAELEAVGVRLLVSSSGELKAKGKPETLRAFMPAIRERKAEIIDALKAPVTPLSAENESAIRAWLDLIGETDFETIAEVLEGCRRDAEVRAYFIKRAADDLSPRYAQAQAR
jgi:hypothetical protein